MIRYWLIVCSLGLLLAACSSPSSSQDSASVHYLSDGESLQLSLVQAGAEPHAYLAPANSSQPDYTALAPAVVVDDLKLSTPLTLAFSKVPVGTRVIDMSVWQDEQMLHQTYQLYDAASSNALQLQASWLESALASSAHHPDLPLRLHVQLLGYSETLESQFFWNEKPDNSALGLLQLPVTHYDEELACEGDAQQLLAPAQRAADAVTLPEGTQAVIIVHGWQVLSQMLSVPQKTQYMPGLCNWLPFIHALAADEDSSLRDRYRFFSFDYDSYLRVADNSDYLAREVARVFGSSPVILLGHSMGGMIINDYVQSHDNHAAQVITVGSPLRGSNAFVCTAHDGNHCTEATPNPSIPLAGFINLLQVLDKTVEFAGTLDLAWEYPGYKTGEHWYWCGWKLCIEPTYSLSNPFLDARNTHSDNDYSRHTAVTLTIPEGSGDATDIGLGILQRAIAKHTGHQNDGIVPLGSACLGLAMAATPDPEPCTQRLISKRLHLESNHTAVISNYALMKQILMGLEP